MRKTRFVPWVGLVKEVFVGGDAGGVVGANRELVRVGEEDVLDELEGLDQDVLRVFGFEAGVGFEDFFAGRAGGFEDFDDAVGSLG